MIKKLACILLTALTINSGIYANAATEASNINGYTVISGTGKIRDFSNSTISPFTEDSQNISYVAMMSGVSYVGNNAFKNCKMIRDVIFPSSVREIGAQAFAGCESISTLVIPYGVTYIMNYAFIDCKNLKEVYIPDTVNIVGESAFYGCDNLTVYAGASSVMQEYCKNEGINIVTVDKVQNTVVDVLNDIKIYINGKELEYNYPVVMKNSTTLIPLRSIFEAVGCVVAWDDSTKTAYAEKDGITLALKTNSQSIFVNGIEKTLSTPTTLMCDNTMVHIRAIEHLGINVEWDGDARTISVTY